VTGRVVERQSAPARHELNGRYDGCPTRSAQRRRPRAVERPGRGRADRGGRCRPELVGACPGARR
jgi:hypothetical protein